MVPVPLAPSDAKANSVLLCFFSFLKSTAPRPEDSSLKREMQTAVQVIHPVSSQVSLKVLPQRL